MNIKQESKLQFKYLSNRATAPKRATPGSIGYDLASAREYFIPPNGKYLCDTDLAVVIPEGCYGQLASRSGLALYHSIIVGGGVIDPDFDGHIRVLLFNHGREEYRVRAGQYICQLILVRAETPEVEEIQRISRDSKGFGIRGDKGFGSTGI